MSDYERGLADAAAICRKQARACMPFRRFAFQFGPMLPRLVRATNIQKQERARMAIKCARAIDAKRKERDA